MASAQASDSLFCRQAISVKDFDPDSTNATDVAWVDMRGYKRFGVIAYTSVGDGVTAFKILANTKSDGSGTDREIKAHAVGSSPDSVGDYLVLECSAEEIAKIGADNSEDLRYVSANLTAATNTNECAVVYIMDGPEFAKDGLTADYTSD